MLKKLFITAILGASALSLSAAWAHGDNEPNHGGVVQAAGGLSFELVAQGNAGTIYVEDHGRPRSTAGMTGKLTALNGREKTEAELKPAGDNKLAAQGVKFAKGASVTASITTAENKAITVRFTVR